MKKKFLEQIIEKKSQKIEFSVLTNLKNGENAIFEKNKKVNKSFQKYSKEINLCFKSKKNGIIDNTNIFIETYSNPIKIFIIGAVHIAQFLVNFTKDLNFEISIIDPRGFFASKKKFPGVNIITKWPKEAFKELKADKNTALIALTHDPKIDDPAIQYALNNNFFYIGALGSKKTHASRCNRLKKTGYNNKKISTIFGPIGIKLGGKSAPEIALSIVAQLVLEVNKEK